MQLANANVKNQNTPNIFKNIIDFTSCLFAEPLFIAEAQGEIYEIFMIIFLFFLMQK